MWFSKQRLKAAKRAASKKADATRERAKHCDWTDREVVAADAFAEEMDRWFPGQDWDLWT